LFLSSGLLFTISSSLGFSFFTVTVTSLLGVSFSFKIILALFLILSAFISFFTLTVMTIFLVSLLTKLIFQVKIFLSKAAPLAFTIIKLSSN